MVTLDSVQAKASDCPEAGGLCLNRLPSNDRSSFSDDDGVPRPRGFVFPPSTTHTSEAAVSSRTGGGGESPLFFLLRSAEPATLALAIFPTAVLPYRGDCPFGGRNPPGPT